MENIFDKLVVTEVCNVHTVHNPTKKSSAIINRKSYGISFCREGKIIYTHNGKDAVEDRTHAVILPQGQSYTLFCEEGGSFPVIEFFCDRELCNTIVSIPIENVAGLISDYEKMLSLCLVNENRLRVISLFYGILHSISMSSDGSVLYPAMKCIEENFTDPALNNSILASKCRISEVYFRRLFLERYKTTPKQYVIDMRINRAKQLLSEGSMKITAISEGCGFSSPYHFCRTFKRHVGVTPTEYMMNNRAYRI